MGSVSSSHEKECARAARSLRHVVASALAIGVDPSRVAVAGDGGGGYVAVGACMHLALS